MVRSPDTRRTVLTLLASLALPFPALEADSKGASSTFRLLEVEGGAILLKTDEPGRYILAPTALRQEFANPGRDNDQRAEGVLDSLIGGGPLP